VTPPSGVVDRGDLGEELFEATRWSYLREEPQLAVACVAREMPRAGLYHERVPRPEQMLLSVDGQPQSAREHLKPLALSWMGACRASAGAGCRGVLDPDELPAAVARGLEHLVSLAEPLGVELVTRAEHVASN
jgi:hypothetical protein